MNVPYLQKKNSGMVFVFKSYSCFTLFTFTI